ncbi:GroES-like protein [Clavulina sp. PMI_390]|nr:GroES-like protein [Clavulina sp. PMI_390]
MATAERTHLALVQEDLGKLVAKQVPTPPLASSQVQIRLSAIAINPVDQRQLVLGTLTGGKERLPYIAGLDGSGIVTAVGSDVKHVEVGDRVAYLGLPYADRESGTYQELATGDATMTIKIPSSMSFVQGTSFSLGYYAAYVGLYHPNAVGLPAPGSSEFVDLTQPILVWGAGSVVGRSAVQLLSLSGYTNILAVSGSHRFDDLRAFGATVFDYKDADVVGKIKAALNGKEIKAALDSIATPLSLVEVAKLISPGGRLATTLFIGTEVIPLGEATIRRTFITLLWLKEPEFGRPAREYLQKLIASGKWKLPVIRELTGGLAGGAVEQGIDLFAQKEVHGEKIVVSGVNPSV